MSTSLPALATMAVVTGQILAKYFKTTGNGTEMEKNPSCPLRNDTVNTTSALIYNCIVRGECESLP